MYAYMLHEESKPGVDFGKDNTSAGLRELDMIIAAIPKIYARIFQVLACSERACSQLQEK